jgi:hypothetical protein
MSTGQTGPICGPRGRNCSQTPGELVRRICVKGSTATAAPPKGFTTLPAAKGREEIPQPQLKNLF